MKVLVLAVIVLFVGLATAAGSGPYLPSGWRPRGAAFLLPSEVEKSSETVKESPVQEESSGSDFFREYGPPKVVSEDITLQELPDVATERAFAAIQIFDKDSQELIEDVQKEEDETVSETTTETDLVTEKVEIQERSSTVDEEKLNESVESKNAETVETTEVLESNVISKDTEEIVRKGELSELNLIENQEDKTNLLKNKSEDATKSQTIQEANSENENIGIVEDITKIDADYTTENLEHKVISKQTEEVVKKDKSSEFNLIENQENKSELLKTKRKDSTTSQSTQEADSDNANTGIIEDIIKNDESQKSTDEEDGSSDVEIEIEQQVKAVEQGVRSIAEVLMTLENEVKSQQNLRIGDVNNIQERIGSIQAPLQFLEYGPPGFKEYGPPKEDLLRSDVQETTSQSSPDVSETNAERRRRFSPKFKSSTKRKSAQTA